MTLTTRETLRQLDSTSKLRRLRALAFGLALTLVATTPVLAGGFLTPLEGVDHGRATVITTDGQILEGEIWNIMNGYRGTKRITLRDLDGDRHRLRARDIRSILMPLDQFDRLGMALDATTTIEKAIETDWDLIEDVDEVVYDSLAWPEADRRIVLQRINPGFDSAIQVYALNNAREFVWKFKGIPIAGDQEKAFLVVKNGETPFKLKKRKYEDEFFTLFADCPAVLDSLEDNDADFEDFADHVRLYDQTCGYGTAEPATATEEIAALD